MFNALGAKEKLMLIEVRVNVLLIGVTSHSISSFEKFSKLRPILFASMMEQVRSREFP